MNEVEAMINWLTTRKEALEANRQGKLSNAQEEFIST
jgi:hypothetical protein